MLPPLSDFRLVVPDRIVSRVVDGMTVLLDIESGRTFSFDEIGTRAWTALTEAPSAQSALDLLRSEYAAPAGVLERDLVALIERLSAGNLVQVERR